MDYLKLFEQQIDRIIGQEVNELITRQLTEAGEPVGREFQHIEDLVYIYGPAGAKKAIDRIASIGKNSKHMELKWDGSPAIIFGRAEDGTFHFGDKYSKEIIGSGTDVYNQYVGRSGASVSDDRKQFAGEMSQLYDLYEAATPKDFRGFLEGALLYKTRPQQNKHGEYFFQPNTVIYYVAADSKLGKRIAQSITASTATAYFDNLPALGGQRQAVGDKWKTIGSKDVIILPPKFATDVQADIPEEAIKNLYQYLSAHKSKIEKFVTPSAEWNATYKDPSQGPTKWREIIYKYVNSQVDNPTGLENLGTNMAQWAEGDPILAGGKRREIAINDIKNAGDNLTATFRLVRGIMKVKDEVVDQLEHPTLSSVGIRAELPGGAPGGEGFVSDPAGGVQPLKFVKRGTFTAANRAKGRVSMKESISITPKLIKTKFNLNQFENRYGSALIEDENGNPRINKKLESYFAMNNLSSELFYFAVNESLSRLGNHPLSESIESEDDLQYIFDNFDKFSTGNKVRIGNKYCLLDLEAYTTGRSKNIELGGFTNPKKIIDVVGSVLIFEDGTTYPSKKVEQSRIWRQVIVFDSSSDLSQCLTLMSLIAGKNGDWNFKIQVDRSGDNLQESVERTGRGDTAVVGWGRGMGHKGHMYLASAVFTTAKKVGGDPYFIVSETVGKDDPLLPDEKLEIYRTVFPEHKNSFQTSKNLIDVLHELSDDGYKNCVVIVGEDQKSEFQYLLKYNGQPAKTTGNVIFNFDTLKIISRQETGDKYAGEAGPRATTLREILKKDDVTYEEKFKVWRNAMPNALDDGEVEHYMQMAAQRLGFPVEQGLDEADNPNYFGAGGGSPSAIPGTPQSLQQQPTEDDIRRYHKEMKAIKRFMSGH